MALGTAVLSVISDRNLLRVMEKKETAKSLPGLVAQLDCRLNI
jgi:hypothetical protein